MKPTHVANIICNGILVEAVLLLQEPIIFFKYFIFNSSLLATNLGLILHIGQNLGDWEEPYFPCQFDRYVF